MVARPGCTYLLRVGSGGAELFVVAGVLSSLASGHPGRELEQNRGLLL
jgi:hypothetical protein